MREDIKKRIEQIRRGEVPEGYENKRYVGLFPVDWELQRLVKYADKVVDGTHTTPKYVKNGVPFYSVETITSNDFKNVKFISHEEHLQLSKRCKVEKGDILLTRIGTIGKTALVDWDEEGSIYVSLALIKISNQNLRSYFYEYSKSSLFVKEVLRKSLLLATPPKINMNDIEKVELVLPTSRAEQRKITEILSACDRVIELKKKLIEEKKKVKKWFMQTLLTGMIRVKDIENKTPYEELKKRIEQIRNGQAFEGYEKKIGSDIIPTDWKTETLLELSSVITKGTTPTTLGYSFVDSGVNFIKVENISDSGSIVPETLSKISLESHKKMKRSILKKDDVLVSIAGAIGRVTVVSDDLLPANINQALAIVRPHVNACERSFVRSLLASNSFQKYVLRITTTGAQPNISLKQVGEFIIQLPSLEEQTQISEILSESNKEIDLLNKDLEQWELKKKSLMQLLLTGIVRVNAEN